MIVLLLVGLSCVAAALGIPTWERFNSRSSIGSLVPGATVIEAKGLPYGFPYYLSVSSPPGLPGNATLAMRSDSGSAPLFFISHGRLYQYTNDSYILSVNVLNTTAIPDEPMPYKLALGYTREGLHDTEWRWRGAFLYFDLGQKANQALFYTCLNKAGQEGIYMYLEPHATPDSCKIFTAHSPSQVVFQEQQTSS